MVRQGDIADFEDRYNWHENADPADVTFLAHADPVDYSPDGETAVTYVRMYEEEGNLPQTLV